MEGRARRATRREGRGAILTLTRHTHICVYKYNLSVPFPKPLILEEQVINICLTNQTRLQIVREAEALMLPKDI